MIPLFVCHANCSRSMIAAYLFRDIAGAPALSAGMEAGDLPAQRAVEMLAYWGIDARAHRPRQVDRPVCDQGGLSSSWPRRTCGGFLLSMAATWQSRVTCLPTRSPGPCPLPTASTP